MEFKKPNGYGRERPRQNGSHPGDLSFVSSRPTRPPAPSVERAPLAVLAQPPRPAENINTSGVSTLKTVIASYVRRFLSKKKSVIILAVVIIGLIVIGVLINQRSTADESNGNNGLSASIESLEYQTIVPEGKSISDLGGWKRVSPSKSEPVYAYTDTIGETSINVSEQPLPGSFIGDTDNQVAELAKKFNATTKIDAGGTKVYVGSSSKGPQSVIFTKNSLLILIKSQEKIDDTAWIKYIKSLS